MNEIGFGYDKTDLAVLCLKGIPKGGLPEYIRSAKVIRDIYDLNVKISRIKGVGKEILMEKKMLFSHSTIENPLYKVMDKSIVMKY